MVKLKKLMESSITSYIDNLTNFKFNEHQSNYFKWQKSQLKIVKIQSYKVNKDLNELVTDFLKYEKLKMKECFYNATKLCMVSNDIKYVEGFAVIHGLPIEHAWNCYKNKIHFDLTSELLFNDFLEEYGQIVILPGDTVFKYISKNKNLTGEMMQQHYINTVLK